MKREHGAVFRQSLNDFPCTVTLGRDTPSFGLHRYKQGLRFFPTDDEGFTKRGDKKQLLYKGRRRSHRFTILDNTAFEYDCILLKEPESNIITLRMEGSEYFDFLRQPDFVKNKYHKGSYAVYKKETWIGEGTGKLCHIHRPKIYDARGRSCWGELSVVGNELNIIIPEKWLGEAKYPVIVDPAVGNQSIGYQNQPTFTYDNGYVETNLRSAIAVNNFYVPDRITSFIPATAYYYLIQGGMGCKPVLYKDGYSYPSSRISQDETKFDVDIILPNKPGGWRTANFTIKAYDNPDVKGLIWFGISTISLNVCYDYDNRINLYWYGYENGSINIPEYFRLKQDRSYYNYKFSMYFTYELPKNYVCTLTQGVNLTDTRILIGNYHRKNIHMVGVNSLIKGLEAFYRKCVMTAVTTINFKYFPFFIRNVKEKILISMDFFLSRFLFRECKESIFINLINKRLLNIFRTIQEALEITDNKNIYFFYYRKLNENIRIKQYFSHLKYFIRVLREISENTAETKNIKYFYRKNKDTVQTSGSVIRHLLIIIKVFSSTVIRDFFIKRFLVSKEEIKIKSCITKEITLESKII